MKKWFKRLALVLLLIFIAVVVYVAWNWSSFSIIAGTGSIGEGEYPIPEPLSAVPDLGAAGESDWPSWYGPNGDRRSLSENIQTDWSAGLEQVWETHYLCQGRETAAWSSPAIRGNRMIVCGRSTEHDMVFCLDPEDGTLIWYTSYETEAKSNHGSGPRATPYIDGASVYTFGRSGDLVAWQLLDGEKLWHVNVEDLGGEEPVWGHSSSPLIVDSLLLIQGGGSCRTLAFNKHTGALVWKSGEGLAGYAALQPAKLDQMDVVLAFHGTGLAALNLKSGYEYWNVGWKTSYDVNATTPLVSGNKIFITSGYGTGGMMLSADTLAAVSEWVTEEFSSIHSDPYEIDGYIYGYSGDSHQNRGAFKCLDQKTGDVQWSTDEMGWGTCTWVDGYLLCCDIKGNIYLMKPVPEKFILVTKLEKALGNIPGPVWTVPVVANGRLFLRYKQKLVCYNLE
jgi:outer membrane protein assembly factor BamB